MPHLITFATLQEATSTLTRLEARQINPSFYVFRQGAILITGMGILETWKSLQQYAYGVQTIWNLGAAGALQSNLHLFSLHKVQYIERHFPGGSAHARQLFFRMYPHLQIAEKGLRLLCSDISLNEPCLQRAELVDMESYAIAKFCIERTLPCKIIKCISDFANLGTPLDIQKHMHKISTLLAERVYSELMTAVS